jgi:serine/threonine-protein kinase
MGYSAPEQYGQGQTDARSDVYALAVLIHQLISAHDPISQPFNVPLAHRLNPRVPEQFSAALQTAMSHDPEDRFGSMVAFRRALLNAAGNVPSQPFVAAPRPAAPTVQPQVGYAPPQAGYNQPTPQRPLSQGYAPPPAQPYSQPMPQHPSAQGYPVYAQPAHPVAYGLPPGYPQPHFHPPVTEVTTGLAQTSRWMGVVSLVMLLSSFVLPAISYDFAIIMAVFGLFVAGVAFIVSLVALNHTATKNSIKGRSHAGLGMALSIISILLMCASIANLEKY